MEGNKTKENGIAMRPLKAKNATAISYDEGSATLRIVKSDGSKVSFHDGVFAFLLFLVVFPVGEKPRVKLD